MGLEPNEVDVNHRKGGQRENRKPVVWEASMAASCFPGYAWLKLLSANTCSASVLPDFSRSSPNDHTGSLNPAWAAFILFFF